MDITNLSAYEMSNKLSKKEISATELLKAAFANIEKNSDKINTYISTRKEKALKEAQAVDQKISSGEKLSPLEGIPVGLKDNMILKGEISTSASKMLENYVGLYDSTVAAKIKKEGSIIVGKTNLDEFAMGVSTKTSYFGVTKNPLDISKVSGGSSGGSAATVAALEVPIAFGSDTGGSIRQPASYCGVIGLKPTYGAVSRYGLMAFASSLDQIGPFARTTEDIALSMNMISGHDNFDVTSSKNQIKNYLSEINLGIKDMKIGVLTNFLEHPALNPEIKKSLLSSLKILKELGAKIVEIKMPILDVALEAYYIIAPAEASSNLARYDGIRYGYRAKDYKNLEELYVNTRTQGFGSEVKRRLMIGNYVLSSGYYDAYYKKAMDIKKLVTSEVSKVFKKVDMIFAPTVPNFAFGIEEKHSVVDMYLIDRFTVPANIAGIPAISIPSDKVGNMYSSFQLFADKFKENKLLRASKAFENVRGKIDYKKLIGGQL